ncbi:Xaa-Pro dipeptidase [Aliidiomarina taiwanensis]|uniref:Xaa-Pro dipeptidase n=1 Tax=Aliidiomarina taiwanensis TaxID=946228 RepID=A0A432X8D3_9GAMM|nr:Xaa-Pro dipeptidase [Aliidiomarina taiwanensis]RUO43675.1 Xaa-Pro dipeptidase [Aliidiomarina taiwanensis]
MELQTLFPAHIAEMTLRSKTLCEREGYELLAIHAGQLKRAFLDDMEYPFKANPHFKSWCPLDNLPHSWVVFNPNLNKPTLVILHSEAFWYEQPNLSTAPWVRMFHVELIARPDQVDRILPYDRKRAVYIGEHIEVAQALGFELVNPEAALSFLSYYRAIKTDYELQCIRRANETAIRGHRAVAEIWAQGASEFDCLMVYMQATQQRENEMHYPPIIGENEHAAILHYRGKSTLPQRRGEHRSLMIDAGANYAGYAADISRSYSGKDASDEYKALIEGVAHIAQALVLKLKPGMAFADLHHQAHVHIAQLLIQFGICSINAEDIVENQISHVFMPHGIGHFIGLQVHDVGGNLANEYGQLAPSPQNYPQLKSTRTIAPAMALTIEPGIYFIDSLLHQLQESAVGRTINWQKVEALSPYGGIRIEDNIIIHSNRNENVTRELGLG